MQAGKIRSRSYQDLRSVVQVAKSARGDQPQVSLTVPARHDFHRRRRPKAARQMDVDVPRELQDLVRAFLVEVLREPTQEEAAQVDNLARPSDRRADHVHGRRRGVRKHDLNRFTKFELKTYLFKVRKISVKGNIS